MDPDLLRIILVVLGVVLVAGIYFWDKYKTAKKQKRFARVKEERQEPQVDGRRDPMMDESSLQAAGDKWSDDVDDYDNEPEEPTSDLQDGLNIIEKAVDKREKEAKPVPPVELTEWHTVEDEPPQMSMNLSFGAHDETDYLHLDPALRDEIPRKIVQINIVAKPGKPFSGARIFKTMKDVDMHFGEMQIFHRTDAAANNAVLFSLANIVEPGNFPKEQPAREVFTSPGLTLFTQLPGVRDGLAVYADMLFTAERMAVLLDGLLQDQSHSTLTKQTIEATREEILEHRRQIQLLHSRHKK